jgi:hypothetical protein
MVWKGASRTAYRFLDYLKVITCLNNLPSAQPLLAGRSIGIFSSAVGEPGAADGRLSTSKYFKTPPGSLPLGKAKPPEGNEQNQSL